MNIFDRAPSGIFNPLTGNNNRRAWELITRLYEQYFNANSVPDYPDGYLHEKIVKEIERFLLDAGWENEESIEPQLTTPIVVQANQLLNRLVDTGWLDEERVGLRSFISMRPSAVRLFDLLQQFTNESPQLLGGNVLLIYNQLKGVMQDPKGQASGFVSAAHLCVQLINSLGLTTSRVRDLMKELTKEDMTPIFVRRFFTEHISNLYVRDYKQLKTENHPLRLRYDIIEMVNELYFKEETKSALLSGYAELQGMKRGDEEECLERDIYKFRQLLDVEKFIRRLDDVIDAATQRAIAYLGYRLKASERIEEVILDTIDAVVRTGESGLHLEGKLLTIEPLISEERLRMPPSPILKPTRTPLKKREMTVHERAVRMLRKAMIRHREANPAAVKRYVELHIKPGETVRAENLPIQSVEDAVAYLVMIRLASISSRHSESISKNPLLRDLGFNISLIDEERVDGMYFNTPNFMITRRLEHAS